MISPDAAEDGRLRQRLLQTYYGTEDDARSQLQTFTGTTQRVNNDGSTERRRSQKTFARNHAPPRLR